MLMWVETTLTVDDYFQKAKEFRVWLKLEKGVYFDDLTSADAQAAFEKFVSKWNANRLESMYYTKIPQQVLESVHRTKHKWGFKMNDHERLELASTKDTVDISTNKETTSARPALPSHSTATSRATPKQPASSPREVDDSDDDRKRAKRDRKAYNKHKDMVHEELAPKATGRDAAIEKKRQVGAAVHGAARQKDDAKDGLTLSEDFLMGGSDDFQARVQRRKQAQGRRAEEMNQRDAEAARMQKFLADMGIQPGQERITIAPRQQ
ncbi:hypothetical protein B5M09_009455 [Aphanomyces astaci]|uniref:Uncharacterized protein n=1 Tax=Aphanomyces astaci TaxID=112090 RepID=A0A3R7WMK8_APHAT|nr:hypothetical protein B5M09_009455 [Aphanomyces astaci]